MKNQHDNVQPGPIVLFGSGETLASSGKTHEYVARDLLDETPRMAILETPAGFEPNSDRVAGKIKAFLMRRIQNYEPQIDVLPARKRGTEFSPDNPAVVRPILEANWILLGPGSPTYGARQLRDSLATEMIMARHRLGATLMLSSSSTLAFSKYTMPVYEIYKVGEELHWKEGVDYFSAFGIPLVLIPHWDNSDGGDELDTSRCYMGQARFERLRRMLPADHLILGLDEHTSLTIHVAENFCRVQGQGAVYLLRPGQPTAEAQVFRTGETFSPQVFGQWRAPRLGEGLSQDVWSEALAVDTAVRQRLAQKPEPPTAVVDLATERLTARQQKDWATADALRDEISAQGWQVLDTADGFELEPLSQAQPQAT